MENDYFDQDKDDLKRNWFEWEATSEEYHDAILSNDSRGVVLEFCTRNPPPFEKISKVESNA